MNKNNKKTSAAASFCAVVLVSTLATIGVGALLLGCGDFMMNDAPPTNNGASQEHAPTSTTDATMLSPSPSDDPDAAATADSGGDAAGCTNAVTRDVPMKGFGSYLSFAANDQNNHHTEDICNMREGHCVGRFTLQAAEADALRTKRVVSMRITLTRATAHTACSGSCINPTFVSSTGTVLVRPLRSDFDASLVSYVKRTSTASWTWTSTMDLGQVAGQSVIPSAENTTIVELDPTLWTKQFITKGVPAQTDEMIAVHTSFSDVNTPAPYVLVVGNGTDVTPSAPPVLRFAYCPT